MNLDSLTDLVSNGVGVLILFLLITAMQTGQPVLRTSPPIERDSNLTPAFFYVYGDRVRTVDVDVIMNNALLAAGDGRAPASFTVSGDFIGRRHDTLELLLEVAPGAAEDWPRLDRVLSGGDAGGGGPSGRARVALDPAVSYAFLFVYDDAAGLRSFRRLKQWFLDRGVAVGWLPVTDANPAYFCHWSDVPACRYPPSYDAGSPR